MARHRRRQLGGCLSFGLLAGLLLTLLPWLEGSPEGKEREPDGTRQEHPAKRLHVTIQHGRLSVDLGDADMGEVLAQIGQKAGILIILGPSSGKRISAQIMDAKLEEGLRRLLQLASLSHAILYAQGSTGMLAIREVRVFGEDKGRTALPPIVVEHDLARNLADAGQRFSQGLLQAASPAENAGIEASEIIDRFRVALERGREQDHQTMKGEDSGPVRHFREVIDRALQAREESAPLLNTPNEK
jgi:hypothetical protein